jgi:hypothetical protein
MGEPLTWSDRAEKARLLEHPFKNQTKLGILNIQTRKFAKIKQNRELLTR